tara:strand:- start:75 stop:560 length:486 start_codon:yes stop_codon:yes gene_type:complete
MILQYFKKKENEFKIKADTIYLNTLNKSKLLLDKKYFNEINFSTTFEIISILLIFHLKFSNEKDWYSKNKINEELMKNLINDLDKSLRDVGISDMSIGKYVKKYVKKFYYRLKVLDLILKNKNQLEFLDYLNSLKFIKKNNSNELANELLVYFPAFKKINK